MSEIANVLNHPDTRQVFIDNRAPYAPTLEYDAECRFVAAALEANDKLRAAAIKHPKQFNRALVAISTIGVSLNPALQLAYLVPRRQTIALDISYRGLYFLATQTGAILWAQCDVVREQDEFIHNGPGQMITHKFQAFVPEKERGPIVGVYCVAKLADGDYHTTLMDREEIDQVRKSSGGGGVWEKYFGEMAKKSVMKRAYKLWPKTQTREMTERMAEAVYQSNLADDFDDLPDVTPKIEVTGTQVTELQDLIAKGDPLEMLAFSDSAGPGVMAELQDYFPAGKKGKLQKLIGQLLHEGSQMLQQYASDYREGSIEADQISLDVPDNLIDRICVHLESDEEATLRASLAVPQPEEENAQD